MTERQPSLFERWKIVPGFEGRYSVSDLGNIRNNETRSPVAVWKSPSRDGRDYFKVCLHVPADPGKRERKQLYVHRLVVAVFEFDAIDLPDNLHVHHRDRDREHNALANLEAIDAYEHLSQHSTARLEEAF